MQPGGSASQPLAFWPQSPMGGLTPGVSGGNFFCNICQLSCSGPQPWRQHVESARHMKLQADFNRRRGVAATGAVADSSPANISSSSSVLSVTDSDSPVASPSRRPPGTEARAFFCETCQLACTGPEPWKQHIDSAKHLKRVSQEGCVTSDGGSASQPPIRPGSSLSVDDVLRTGRTPSGAVGPAAPPPGVGPVGGNFYCQICRLSCSGPEPWKQHVQSAKHLKKKTQAETMPWLAAGGGAGGGVDRTVTHDDQTRSSSPSLDGPDGLQNLAVTSDSAPLRPPPSLVAAVDDSFYCTACRINCSGPEPWKQHIESGKHLKMVSQAGGSMAGGTASSRWSPSAAGGESLAVVSDSVPPRPAGSTPPGATGGSLYCTACRVYCSGPEPWKQHTESAKHIKMASQYGEPLAEPPRAASEVSSSTGSVEPDGHRQGLNPFNTSDTPDTSNAFSTSNPFNPFYSAAVSDSVELNGWEADGASPQLRKSPAGGGTDMYSSPGISVSGRSTPAAGTNSSRSTPASGTNSGWSTPVPGSSSGWSTPVAGTNSGWSTPVPGTSSGRFTPVAGTSSGRFTPASVTSSGWSTPVPGTSSGRFTPVAGTSSGRFAPAPATPVGVGVGVGGVFRCDLCQLTVTGPEPLQQHMLGAKHRKMAATRQRAFPGVSADSVDSPPARVMTPAPPPTLGRPAVVAMDVDPALDEYDSAPGPELDAMDPELSFACRSIRIGSQLHDRLDRKDGISQEDSNTAGAYVRQLHVEGLVAFLEDTPLVRHDQPFSITRC